LNKVIEKVKADDCLPEEQKSEILAMWSSATNAVEFEAAFNEYARTRKLISTVIINVDDSDYLGHVKALDGVVKYVERALKNESCNRFGSAESLSETFEMAAGNGDNQDKFEAIERLKEIFAIISDHKVSQDPVWLFICPNGRNVRDILSVDEAQSLPCRLGLPEPRFWKGSPPSYSYMRNVKFCGFAFPRSCLDKLLRPSVLDGDYNSVEIIWEPGGLSIPVPHGPESHRDLGGFSEVVSFSPRMVDSLPNLYVFEN
jgi:hypothetical protein